MRPESVYLDNNATTRPDPRVLEAMLPLLREDWGNASSTHGFGRPAAKALSAARRRVARALGCEAGEIVFTGSGTESDNLALRGVLLAAEEPRRLVTTAVEHPAVLETARDLADQGLCALTVLPVDGQGRLDLEALDRALGEGPPTLLSVMAANNETGVRFPVEEIGRRAHAVGSLLHVDAVQWVGKEPFDLRELPVDLLTISAHKLHGPKGVGALFVRKGIPLRAPMTGGGQERGRRSGTENPAGAVGLATALELALEAQPQAAPRMAALRDRLERGLLEAIPDLEVTGVEAPRMPHTLHLTLPKAEGESLLLALDREGIAASSGSACSSGSLTPSHVLTAMGLSPERRQGALRLSLSRETTENDVDRVLAALPPIAQRLARLV